MKTLLDAARQLVARYESMPDGDLGRGLTNGDFFALRDALKVFEETGTADTPTSNLRNALQVIDGSSSEHGLHFVYLRDVRARIVAALEQLEGKPL